VPLALQANRILIRRVGESANYIVLFEKEAEKKTDGKGFKGKKEREARISRRRRGEGFASTLF